jgi:hypothetical protein
MIRGDRRFQNRAEFGTLLTFQTMKKIDNRPALRFCTARKSAPVKAITDAPHPQTNV